MKPGKRAVYLVTTVLAIAALPAMAVDYIVWSGAAGDGKWETDGNWKGNVKPTGAEYAKFSEPYGDDMTVSISDHVSVYGLSTSSSRTGTVTLTGDGLLEITSDFLRENRYCPIIWDVNVTNTIDNMWVSLYGDNTFLRRLDMIGGSSGNTFCIRDNSTFRLVGNASALTKYINLENYNNPSVYLSGNSSLDILRDLTLKSDATLSVSNNASLGVRYIYTAPDANISFTGGRITTAGVVSNAMLLAANPDTCLESTASGISFVPFSDAVHEWVMHGGTVKDTNGTSNGIDLMGLTNTTRTISGSGLLQIGLLHTESSSNLVIRLDGPDLYAPVQSDGYGKDIEFQIGGGSTIGTWGNNLSLKYWKTTILGNATVDTTDKDDSTKARNIRIDSFGDSNGRLSVKGLGSLTFATTITQPNLSLVAGDHSAVSISQVYTLDEIVLNDYANLTAANYLGHKGDATQVVKSLTMDGDSTLDVGRYVRLSGDATLSGNASAVIRNTNSGDKNLIFSCEDLLLSDCASLVVTGDVTAATVSLSDSASLVATGQVSATSLTMSGNAHIAFMAGTSFTAGATFGDSGWTMEIAIPSGYEAGIRPVVFNAGFEGDFADHVTLVGDTTGWSARTLDGNLVLYKEAPPSGIEWIGNSTTSDNWSDNANWNGGNIPTADDIVAFGGINRLTPYDDTVGTVSGLVFRASAGPFTLSGADALVLTATSGGRSSVTAANASIVSHSAFDQTIGSFVNFGGNHCAVFTDGGGAVKLTGGLNVSDDWKYFVVCGDVRVNGTCSVGIFSFRNSTTATPSCLRVLSGGSFTIRNQYIRGLVEGSSYIGRIVVEEGASMAVQSGNCVFWYGELENVIDGSLAIQNGKNGDAQLVAGPKEQYYVGKGTIYADSARAAWKNDSGVDRYINFGGTLKLYMNGDWYTATYRVQGSEGVVQNPNCPTRFRMKDGTTLGATADWTYGPAADAFAVTNEIVTAAGRASVMVGTVTVNTQNPTNDTAHTITFIDPLDASAANVVKAGAGTLAFNSTNNCPSQISNLTVNAGSVLLAGDIGPTLGSVAVNGGMLRVETASTLGSVAVDDGATVSFAEVPAFPGMLAITSEGANFRVDGLAATTDWDMLASASDIAGPNGETMWRSSTGKCRFKIVADGGSKKLYGSKATGFAVIVR